MTTPNQTLCKYRQRCLTPFEQTRCFDNYNRCFIYHNFKILDRETPIKTEESEIEKKIKIFGNEKLK